MSEEWKAYPGAPSSGVEICRLDALAEGATCMELAGFPLILLRRGDLVTAFVNACPHQYLPLNHKGDRVLSQDGAVIRCTNHSAGFSAETGEGVEGLGLGACLDPVPISMSGGAVVIG